MLLTSILSRLYAIGYEFSYIILILKITKKALKHLPVTLAICVALFGWVISFYPGVGTFVEFNFWVTNKDYMPPATNQWLWDRLDALIQSDGAVLLGFSTIGVCLTALRRIKGLSPVTWWLAPYLTFYLLWGQGKYEKFYVFIVPALAILATEAIEVLSNDLRNIAWDSLIFG